MLFCHLTQRKGDWEPSSTNFKRSEILSAKEEFEHISQTRIRKLFEIYYDHLS